MGLFSRKKKDPEPVKVPDKIKESKYVNITSKAIRTSISDDPESARFEGGHIWVEGNKLMAFHDKTLLFEITDRSKAFEELKECAGQPLIAIEFEKRDGDYGVYYHVRVVREIDSKDFYAD